MKAYYELTVEELEERLEIYDIFLIYADEHLVGEVNVMYDPPHIYRKIPGSAWIGLVIGESNGRGKGVGTEALRLLEEHLRAQGSQRIELGVFAFNHAAKRLYEKAGYREIGRIEDFTFWNDQFWTDIRMEKCLY